MQPTFSHRDCRAAAAEPERGEHRTCQHPHFQVMLLGSHIVSSFITSTAGKDLKGCSVSSYRYSEVYTLFLVSMCSVLVQ